MSISFLFDKNPDFASAGLGGATVGGARFVRYSVTITGGSSMSVLSGSKGRPFDEGSGDDL